MSVGYGAIYVGGDYKGDLEAIVRVMNQLDWGDSYDTKFEVINSSVVPKLGWAEYPTAMPRCYVRDDGTPIPYNEIDEDVEFECDLEDVELPILSRDISPLLESGTLRVCAESHERENMYLTTLKISSDGKVEETAQFISFSEADVEEAQKWVFEPRSDLSQFM